AGSELRRGREILRVAFLCASVYPGNDGVYSFLSDATVIQPFAVFGIGMPRWHLSAGDLLAYRSGPWASILISEQRHRGDLARTMTVGAALIEDGRDVLREGDVVANRLTRVVCAGRHGEQASDKSNWRGEGKDAWFH